MRRSRIEQEKRVVEMMVRIYCRRHHQAPHAEVCEECKSLLEYAMQRLSRCPKGERKGSCRKCEIHCYAPRQREAMRQVMRYVGPRMIFHHPVAAIRHIITELK